MSDARSASGRNRRNTGSDATEPVSVTKPAAKKQATATQPAGTPVPRPTQVLLAVVALVVSALGVAVASISLFFLHSWLLTSTEKSNKHPAKGKKALTHQQIIDQVHSVPKSQATASVVLVLALVFVAFAAYRGRYWSRWAVLGLWVLSSFTGALCSLNYIFAIRSSSPLAFKLPTFLSAVAFVVAVVAVLLRPSAAYFNQNKPVRPAGAPARGGLFGPRPAGGGGGLFGPRPAAGGASRGGAATREAQPAAAAGVSASGPDRSRSKKRSAEAQAVAKGADLARTRAKAASKSRRTEA
ncbi:hypothetical protein [uncultured Jatrophihabitans sp.]|uniref:hypothetical protein n=1 Tax=uncultured Jatrophihabitans sp. TaxID=1610747 RepID=UPI0035C9E892